MNRLSVLLLLALSLSACAVLPRASVELEPGAEAVRVANSIPLGDYEEVGVVFASDGYGCGALGKKGIYQIAENKLKNKAVAMGASYVRVQSVTEPHASKDCFENELKVYGSAYKRRDVSTPPAPLVAITPEKEPAEKIEEKTVAEELVPQNDTLTERDVIQKLRELKTLRDEEIITEEEFTKLKTGLLDEAY